MPCDTVVVFKYARLGWSGGWQTVGRVACGGAQHSRTADLNISKSCGERADWAHASVSHDNRAVLLAKPDALCNNTQCF